MMSKVLVIRHLPTALTLKEKEQLLKHFGAEKVWEPTSKRNYTFAAFSSEHTAQQSLYRLHQLQIANRRLVVEYSFDKEPALQKKDDERSSVTTKHVKEFLRRLNAWNPSVDFYQPPTNYLKYKYPDISPKIIINIIHALISHTPLYVQTLHLMNKMSLQTPFTENDKAMEYFKETFREFFLDQIVEIPVPDLPTNPVSEPESELSSDETEHEKHHQPALSKRKHTLPVTRKRPAAVLKTAVLPKVKKTVINQEEVFDTVKPVQEPKKISLVVHQDALQKPAEETEVVGELGKFQKEDEPVPEDAPTEEPDLPTITKNELLRNRISRSDMKVMKVFKNYHPGQPSMRLYIKNLAKSVTEQELKRIYRRYIEGVSEEEQIGFDVRVMQEGRMKGQAFVTFPSERMAERALNETNGYMLKEKPMVVQFARAANKTVQ